MAGRSSSLAARCLPTLASSRECGNGHRDVYGVGKGVGASFPNPGRNPWTSRLGRRGVDKMVSGNLTEAVVHAVLQKMSTQTGVAEFRQAFDVLVGIIAQATDIRAISTSRAQIEQ